MSDDDIKRVDFLQINSEFAVQPGEVEKLAKVGTVKSVTYVADLEGYSMTIEGGKQTVNAGKATKVEELSLAFEDASLQDYLNLFAQLESMGCQVNFAGEAGTIDLKVG